MNIEQLKAACEARGAIQRAAAGTVPEIRETGSKRKLTGYAAVFDSVSGDMGGWVEVIRRGAFDKALKGNPDVSARVQHESGLTTIGRTSNGTLKLTADSKGLRYEVTLPNTTVANDIYELVRGGYINKSSFAFSVKPEGQRWNMNRTPPLRELIEIHELVDVAPVDGPAYQATSVEARQRATLPQRGVTLRTFPRLGMELRSLPEYRQYKAVCREARAAAWDDRVFEALDRRTIAVLIDADLEQIRLEERAWSPRILEAELAAEIREAEADIERYEEQRLARRAWLIKNDPREAAAARARAREGVFLNMFGYRKPAARIPDSLI